MTTLVIEPAREQHRVIARSWHAYATVCLIVLAAFCVEHVLRPVPAFPYDDPYIALHSAQVLHTGFDSNYPGVAALFGVTSAPFLALLYLLLFILPPLQALDVSCWIGVLFYALGLVRLGRVLQLGRREQWLLAFIGVASTPVPIHCINGLETSCALASITWMLCFASGERRGWFPAAFLCGLTATFRPDLLPLAGLLALLLIWRMLRSSAGQGRPWGRTLALALVSAAPVLLCSFWYLHTTGSPMPSTGMAKRYFFAEDHWTFLYKIEQELSQILIFILATGPLVLAVPKMGRHSLGKVLLAGIAFFALVLFVQFPGEFQINEFRYPVVLIPVLLWGLGMTVKDAEPSKRLLSQRLLQICALYAVLMLPISFYLYKGERRSFEIGTRQVARWCQQNLPPGTTLLVHDAGYLAYSTDFRLFDFVGLKTPSAVPVNREYTWVSAGTKRVEAVSTIAAQSGSRYLILNMNWPPVAPLPKHLRSLSWKVQPLYVTGAWTIFGLTPPAPNSQIAESNRQP